MLLEDQDRSRWDRRLIVRGAGALRRARALAARQKPVGRYYLQALIAAEHARAERADDTDWRRIADLYDVLAGAAPGPVVEVNRAVAHGRAFGPAAGLAVLDALAPDALGDSPLVPSVRGDLLERAGRHARRPPRPSARRPAYEERERARAAGASGRGQPGTSVLRRSEPAEVGLDAAEAHRR